jgi:hypothetical protein
MGRRPPRTKTTRAKEPPTETKPGHASGHAPGDAPPTAQPRRRFTLSQAAAAVIAAVIALLGVIISTYAPFGGEPTPKALTPHSSGSPSGTVTTTSTASANGQPTGPPVPTYAITPTRTGEPPRTTPPVRTLEPPRPTTTLQPIQIDAQSYKELYWGRIESINLAWLGHRSTPDEHLVLGPDSAIAQKDAELAVLPAGTAGGFDACATRWPHEWQKQIPLNRLSVGSHLCARLTDHIVWLKVTSMPATSSTPFGFQGISWRV